MTTTAPSFVLPEAGRLLTVADWLDLGEDELHRWELVEGNLVMAPSPIPEHSIALRRLGDLLARQLPAGFEVVPDTDLDMRLAGVRQPGTVRRPDIALVSRAELDRRHEEGGILRADGVVLVVEILSPGSVRTDQIIKRRDYADAGIPHYWIVDLEPRPSLTACRLENGSYVDDGPVTGRFQATEPFPVQIDLDALI